MLPRRAVLASGATLFAGLGGCSAAPGGGTTDYSTQARPTWRAVDPIGTVPAGPYWYPHPQPTGNRVLEGSARLAGREPVRIPVEGHPHFLVGHPGPSGSRWTLVTRQGAVTRWAVADGTATRNTASASLPAGMPPVVAGLGGDQELVVPPAGASPHAGVAGVDPGAAAGARRLVFVAADGDLVVAGPERGRRLAIDAPPDVRPVALGDGRVAIYGARTTRYGHGALGDGVEPTSLLIVDPRDPTITATASLESPDVFEGIQPLVADLDGDGEPEIVTTVANASDGARIAVFSSAGERLATGPVYGPGWRHQLVAGALGPGGERELAVVLKPHVTHRLEFYRFDGSDLAVRASIDGFSTHTYGSRVIGGSVAGDLAGDGRSAVLVPTTDRRTLAAVRRQTGGASVDWRWALDGLLASNVTGVETPGGGLAVGAATADELLVWQA